MASLISHTSVTLRGSGEGWVSQLLGRAMPFITQFFESSQFSSETKQQQQQQQAVSFRCNFAQRVAKMAATAILPSAGVGASAPTSTLVSMPATAAAGIYKALQATSTTTSGGVLINRVLAHHIQHSTVATCMHYRSSMTRALYNSDTGSAHRRTIVWPVCRFFSRATADFIFIFVVFLKLKLRFSPDFSCLPQPFFKILSRL